MSVFLLTPLAIPALILSIIGRRSRSHRRQAISGIVLSVVVLVLMSIFIAVKISSP